MSNYIVPKKLEDSFLLLIRSIFKTKPIQGSEYVDENGYEVSPSLGEDDFRVYENLVKVASTYKNALELENRSCDPLETLVLLISERRISKNMIGDINDIQIYRLVCDDYISSIIFDIRKKKEDISARSEVFLMDNENPYGHLDARELINEDLGSITDYQGSEALLIFSQSISRYVSDEKHQKVLNDICEGLVKMNEDSIEEDNNMQLFVNGTYILTDSRENDKIRGCRFYNGTDIDTDTDLQ